MQITESLCFDDVLIKPRYSAVESRAHVDLSVKLSKGFRFNHPIIPANMKNVVGIDMMKEIYKSGGLSILHRFMSIAEQIEILNALQKENYNPKLFGFSVGVKQEDKKNIDLFVANGAQILCLDIAHAHSKLGMSMCEYIAGKYPYVLLIAGNVATGEGAHDLWRVGADVVKVGIGSGSICSTRIEAGCGVPQLSAIIEVAEQKEKTQKLLWNKELFFISDGGHKIVGDLVKSLAFADMVMVGGMLSGTNEAPGENVIIDNINYKRYEGSSTHREKHVEGVKALVPTKGPVANVLQKMFDGIRSGCSYQNSLNLSQLKRMVELVKITPAGWRESGAHDVVVLK